MSFSYWTKRQILDVEIAVVMHARWENEQTWLPAEIDDLFYQIDK
jgi:hypothetical protein